MAESQKAEKKEKKLSPDEILHGFQTLRSEQRALTSKLSEFELDSNEHKLVIETLKNVNEDRKCFRLIGGTLVERKVKDVLPALINSEAKLKALIEKMNEQIGKKGQEINEFREKHNISFRDIEKPKEEQPQPVSSGESRGNVLVS